MKNTFPVSHKIIESKTFLSLSPCAKVLLFILYKVYNRKRKKDDNGWFYRSINKLSQDAGMNRRTVKRSKKELIDANLIEVYNSLRCNSEEKEASMIRLPQYKDTRGSDKNTQLGVVTKIHNELCKNVTP